MLHPIDAATQTDALELIRLALREDIGTDDISTGRDCTTDAIVPADVPAAYQFVSRQPGIVCGVAITKLIIENFAPSIELTVSVEDGQQVDAGDAIATLRGPAHDMLTVERTCLNFMCRLSGISTLAGQFAAKIEGTKAVVLDTRKTTPGWRRLEKYAVACGGGANHRMGLYDAIMIKDNHLAFYAASVASGSVTIADAVARARDWINDHAEELPNGKATVLQLEVDTLDQFRSALESSVDIVLLDNMTTAGSLTEAVAIRDQQAPRILLEASGGVNLDTVAGIAQTGVDRISVGAVTHSALNFDIGLDRPVGLAQRFF